MVNQNLKDKAVKGTFWSAADAFLGQGVTFLVGIVLARILSPAEYGLIGIVIIFTIILSGLVDSGFSNALIRKKDTTDKDYNTMFITNMAMSLLGYFLLWISAPAIAQFFERPELVSIARVTGLILIFQAASITQVTILTKRIDFKTKTKASIVAALVSGAVGIGMALMGFGVWSLVGQKVTNTLLYTVCLWILNRWWPNGTFSRDSFIYMWGFGWKMMLSGLLNNIWNQLYQIVVGKFYSPATLGQYSRSKEYANILSANLTSIIDRVTYPVLSEVQDDKERMVSAYQRIIKITMFVTVVCMFFLGAVAEPFICSLIGPQWNEAATYLPLICISMSMYPLHAINLNMLKVLGRSDIFLVLEIIKKIIAILPILLGIFVNIYWMLIGTIFTGVISFFLNTYYTGKSLGYTSIRQLKDIAPTYALSIIIASAVYFLKYLPFNYYVVLAMQIVIGAGVFFAICETTKMPEYMEVKTIVLTTIKKRFISKDKYGAAK